MRVLAVFAGVLGVKEVSAQADSLRKVPNSWQILSAGNNCWALGQCWRMSGEVGVTARIPGETGIAGHQTLLRICLP